MSSVSVSVADHRDLAGLVSLETAFPTAQRWSEDSWRDELAASNRHVLVCRADGALLAAATFAISDDVVDLHRIVTSPGARRCGLATMLVTAGRAWAREQGASRILLEVEDGNIPALALYEAEGFHPIAERRDYYAVGTHAVILEQSLRRGELS